LNFYKGKHYWEGGFENEFQIPKTNKSLQAEIKRSNDLTWVVRTVIIDEQGETVYDEQKESPNATKAGGAETGKTAKSKKASSKASRINDESKRRVCNPNAK